MSPMYRKPSKYLTQSDVDQIKDICIKVWPLLPEKAKGYYYFDKGTFHFIDLIVEMLHLNEPTSRQYDEILRYMSKITGERL